MLNKIALQTPLLSLSAKIRTNPTSQVEVCQFHWHIYHISVSCMTIISLIRSHTNQARKASLNNDSSVRYSKWHHSVPAFTRPSTTANLEVESLSLLLENLYDLSRCNRCLFIQSFVVYCTVRPVLCWSLCNATASSARNRSHKRGGSSTDVGITVLYYNY